MLERLAALFGRKPSPAAVSAPVEKTPLDTRWFQIHQPIVQSDIKYSPKGVPIKNKNGTSAIKRSYVPDMYTRYISESAYEIVGVEIYPNKKLYYRRTDSEDRQQFGLSDGDWKKENAERKRYFLSQREPVSNPALIKKLSCVVEKYHRDVKAAKDKETADILKAALSHKCEL